MSDQQKEVAKLKQHIIDEISAKQDAVTELNEAELETAVGGQGRPIIVNHNMGAVQTRPGDLTDMTKYPNLNRNMGVVRTRPGDLTDRTKKLNLNQNMGVARTTASELHLD